MKSSRLYMSVTRTFNGVLYHIIELPFDNKKEAEIFANKRKKEYPAGKQKVVASPKKDAWGVYEKVSWDHMPEMHRHPKE